LWASSLWGWERKSKRGRKGRCGGEWKARDGKIGESKGRKKRPGKKKTDWSLPHKIWTEHKVINSIAKQILQWTTRRTVI